MPNIYSQSITCEAKRPPFLNDQPWLAIEIPSDTYTQVPKRILGVVGDRKILHYYRLCHVQTIHLIAPQLVQVGR